MRRGCIYRKLLTDLRRLSDEIPTDVKQSVGIPSEYSEEFPTNHVTVADKYI